MAIGEYRHKITFRGFTSTPDGYGGQINTPVDLLTVFSKKVTLRSSRNLSENQGTLDNVAKYEVRYRAGFTPDVNMVIVDKGRIYSVGSVVEVKDNHRFWEITATEQQSKA